MSTGVPNQTFARALRTLKARGLIDGRMAMVCTKAPQAIDWLLERFLAEQSEATRLEIVFAFEKLIALFERVRNNEATAARSNTAYGADGNSTLNPANDASSTATAIDCSSRKELVGGVKAEPESAEENEDVLRTSTSSEVTETKGLRAKPTILSVQRKTPREPLKSASLKRCEVQLNSLSSKEILEWTHRKLEIKLEKPSDGQSNELSTKTDDENENDLTRVSFEREEEPEEINKNLRHRRKRNLRRFSASEEDQCQAVDSEMKESKVELAKNIKRTKRKRQRKCNSETAEENLKSRQTR